MSGESIQLQFRNVSLPPSEQIRTLDINLESDIKTVKDKVRAEFDIPNSHVIELVFSGQHLRDEKKVKEYNMDKKSTISVIPRQTPGCH